MNHRAGPDVKIDVSQIKELPIPRGEFPVPYPRSAFRVYIRPEAHLHMLAHSKTNTSIELCGVLIGEVMRDDYGPFVVVTEMIEGEHAEGSTAGVTFTQDTWAHVFRQLDGQYSGQRVVGWYHTHPGFGIFLSSMDMFIQTHFFNLPWQVAFVVDPLADMEGMFEWRNGDIAPSSPYWVGEQPFVGSHRQRNSRRAAKAPEDSSANEDGPTAGAADKPERRAQLSYVAWHAVQLLLLVALLVMVLSRGRIERFVEQFLKDLIHYWLE